MAPINLKQSQTSATQTIAGGENARLLVRETLRISANLASNQPLENCNVATEQLNLGLVEGQLIDSSMRLICSEEIDGRRWNYVAEKEASGRYKKNSIRAVSLQSPRAPADVSVFSVSFPGLTFEFYFTSVLFRIRA